MKNIQLFDTFESYKNYLNGIRYKENSQIVEELIHESSSDWEKCKEIKRINNIDEYEYFKILDVSSCSDNDKILRSFNKRISQIHPDRTWIPGSFEATVKLVSAYSNVRNRIQQNITENQRELINEETFSPASEDFNNNNDFKIYGDDFFNLVYNFTNNSDNNKFLNDYFLDNTCIPFLPTSFIFSNTIPLQYFIRNNFKCSNDGNKKFSSRRNIVGEISRITIYTFLKNIKIFCFLLITFIIILYSSIFHT